MVGCEAVKLSPINLTIPDLASTKVHHVGLQIPHASSSEISNIGPQSGQGRF